MKTIRDLRHDNLRRVKLTVQRFNTQLALAFEHSTRGCVVGSQVCEVGRREGWYPHKKPNARTET